MSVVKIDGSGPRNRAPLGMKTTNAKAKGPHTPELLLGTVKGSRTRRLGKSKEPDIQLSQPKAEPTQLKVEEDDVPDVEYAPPKPQGMFLAAVTTSFTDRSDLPDLPEEMPYDDTFPQFKGRNYARGWERVYADDEVGPDGLTRKQRELQAKYNAYDKAIDAQTQREVDSMELLGINVRQFPDEPCAEELAREHFRKQEAALNKRSVSTVKARSAAHALAEQRPVRQTRSVTAAAAAAAAAAATVGAAGADSGAATGGALKQTPGGMVRTKQPRARLPGLMAPKKQRTPTNHAAATANSRTTVGYSKGRSVSATILHEQKPPHDKASIASPHKFMELYGPPPADSEMHARCEAAGLLDNPEPETEDVDEMVAAALAEDDEAANFQLVL